MASKAICNCMEAYISFRISHILKLPRMALSDLAWPRRPYNLVGSSKEDLFFISDLLWPLMASNGLQGRL